MAVMEVFYLFKHVIKSSVRFFWKITFNAKPAKLSDILGERNSTLTYLAHFKQTLDYPRKTIEMKKPVFYVPLVIIMFHYCCW